MNEHIETLQNALTCISDVEQDIIGTVSVVDEKNTNSALQSNKNLALAHLNHAREEIWSIVGRIVNYKFD